MRAWTAKQEQKISLEILPRASRTFIFNNYGSVGSVQAGANAVANVVQNLGANGRASLATALQQFKEAIEIEPSLTEPGRQKLLEIAREYSSEISSESPSETKLLDMFTVLGTTLQTLASVPAAYLVLKTSFLVFGIGLP